MIILKDVEMSYGSRQVINNLNLQIADKNIHGLVGLNGSGKTTLLNGVFGSKKVSNGVILYDNEPIRRRDIGYLETGNYFYSRITGMEYLQLFCINNPLFDIKSWNTLFDLPLNDFIEKYSTGMKKKLAFMGIVALDTPILILDEPFNGIDLETMQKFKLIIMALKEKGKTIVITSHILESLTSICDAISYLNEKNVEFTFNKSNYSEMEASIFGRFNKENSKKINDLLK